MCNSFNIFQFEIDIALPELDMCVPLCKLEMWKCVKTTIQNHHRLAQAGQWTSVCRCMRDLESSLPPLMCILIAFLGGAFKSLYYSL